MPEDKASVKPSYLEWYKSTIRPGWTIPKHIEFLCGLVQQVVDGDIKRLLLSLPPGHAKTSTITNRVPNYWAIDHPNDAIVVTGYNQTFAERQLSMPTRELARESGLLGSSATALAEWHFANGARFVARGVDNAPTGVNPISLVLIDDPLKDRAQASSAARRDSMWQWYQGSIVQRFWPSTRVIVIATRWHEDDLIGRIEASEEPGWTKVNLPAIAMEDDPLGRLPGEALWPEGKPLDFLEKQRRAMGDYEFEALFQGNPTPRDGSFFKVTKLETVDRIPPDLPHVRTWDLGGGGIRSDYTVGVKMAGPDPSGYYYVIDVVAGQWEPAERNRVIRQTAELDGRHVMIRVPQDPAAAGKEAAIRLVQVLAGFNVRAEPVTGKKEVRAGPWAAQFNAGNVRMFKGAWIRDFVEQHRQFPLGAHDDIVDASSDAFIELSMPVYSWDF